MCGVHVHCVSQRASSLASIPVNVVNVQTSRRIGARKGCAIRLRPETFEFLTTKKWSQLAHTFSVYVALTNIPEGELLTGFLVS